MKYALLTIFIVSRGVTSDSVVSC